MMMLLFFNFRTDRGQRTYKVLSQEDNLEFCMKKMNLHFVTMTNYETLFK